MQVPSPLTHDLHEFGPVGLTAAPPGVFGEANFDDSGLLRPQDLVFGPDNSLSVTSSLTASIRIAISRPRTALPSREEFTATRTTGGTFLHILDE